MPEDSKAGWTGVRKLRIKDRAIVQALTTPGPTFGNVEETAKLIAPHLDPRRAGRHQVYRALEKTDVQAEIEEAIRAHGATIGWRIKTLRQVADPETILTETKETVTEGEDGPRVTKTITKRPPSASDIVRSIDVLNKMDSTYTKQNLEAQASHRYNSLAGRFHSLLAQDVLPSVDSVTSLDMPKVERKHHGPKRGLCIPGGLPIYAGTYLGSLPELPLDACSEATSNAASVGSEA